MAQVLLVKQMGEYRVFRSLYISFCCLTLLQGVPSFGSILYCDSFLTGENREGFTIHMEDVALNPAEREILIDNKITKLAHSEYLIMETLLLADGAVVKSETFQEEALREALLRGESEDEVEYGKAWLKQHTFRLRRRLKEAFGMEVAERVITVPKRGLVWMTQRLFEQSKKFDPNKITYLPNESRVFVGPQEILLSPLLWTIFSTLMNSKKNAVSTAELQAAWWMVTREEISESGFKVYFFKLNSIFAQAFQSRQEKVFSAISGQGLWQLNARLVTKRTVDQ